MMALDWTKYSTVPIKCVSFMHICFENLHAPQGLKVVNAIRMYQSSESFERKQAS